MRTPSPCGGDGKSPPDFAVYLDRAVGARGQALPAADAGLVHDLQQQRLVARHRDRIGRADADARQAGDAELGVDDEVQVTWSVRWRGDPLQFDGQGGQCQ